MEKLREGWSVSEVQEIMTFGEVLKELEIARIPGIGGKARRKEWEEGVYIWYLPAAEVQKSWVKDPMLLAVFGDEDVLLCHGSIRLKTKEGYVMTGWIPTQIDMFATDWELVK